jgi:hypothetical protein
MGSTFRRGVSRASAVKPFGGESRPPPHLSELVILVLKTWGVQIW